MDRVSEILYLYEDDVESFADGGVIGKPGGVVEPGVKYYGKYVKKKPEERWKSRSYPAQEAKEKNLKGIFDTIFETEDWGGIKGDTPGLTKAEEKAGIKKSDPSRKGKTGGKIPNDWFRRHVSKAIQGDVNALNNLSSITGRSVKDLQNAFGKIEESKLKIKSEAASKSSAKLNPKNKELVDLVNGGATKKADLLDALKVTDDEFQKMVTLAFKQGYENRSRINKGKKITSYLGNSLEEYNNLIDNLNKIDGIDKARERLITSRIQQVYGVDGSHPNSKMFKTMSDRVNEFYKLKKTLPPEIVMNLDHAIPMSVIEQLTEANTLRVNVQPITQSLNMGLKAQVDKAYAAAYKAGNKKTMKAIEEVAEKIDLPMGKITDTFTNLGKNPYLTGDMKQVIYNNLVIQNSISDKAKLLDKKLLKKAGLGNVSFDVSKVDTETVAKLFSKGDANFAKFVKSVGKDEAGFISRELLEGGAKSLGKGFKKIGSGFRKVGGVYEAGFIGADFLNNLDSMDADTAFQMALENFTMGLYKGGKRAQWEDFKNAGTELGHNSENLGEVKGIMDLEKMLAGEKEVLEEMMAYNETNPQTPFPGEEIKWRQELVSKLENKFNDNINTFWSKDNAQDIISNYQDTVGYVARKEYNKNLNRDGMGKMVFGDKKRRANPDMNVLGSPLWEAISDWKTYLPQNLLQNEITKAIPNTLRKLPGIGQIFDPTSEQAKLFDMSDEEIEQRAKDLNIQKQYYHPVTGSTMTEQQMEPYYERYYASGGRAYYMGGGIAGIRRPNAIPPESGPQPQGLENLKYYVTNT